MKARQIRAGLLALIPLLIAGCDLPGRPKAGPEVPRPEAVMNFELLYNENCSGCHGANGQNGAATNLANPIYQAIIDDSSLRRVVAEGEPGTLMPAFSASKGGELSDAQIDAIVKGMRSRWKSADAFGGMHPPPYAATHPGNAANGEGVYSAACARCHGPDARHPGRNGSILDGSFLALINDQTLRTTILAGRPDIGQPDWRGNNPGRPMTDDEITDVTAWLLAQKPRTPGQPYPNQSREQASRPAAQ